MYSAKHPMLLDREDQGIDLQTPEYLVLQVLSRSNCGLPMLPTPCVQPFGFDADLEAGGPATNRPRDEKAPQVVDQPSSAALSRSTSL